MPDRPRILIIDDDHEIVQAISIRLHAAGYNLTAAFDGRQGLASAQRESPNLIVLDVRMPVMDGLATLAELQQHEETKNIPVVMVSASLADKRTAIDMGASHFLGKPFDPHALTSAIASLLGPSCATEPN